jgi:hypothetical protein
MKHPTLILSAIACSAALLAAGCGRGDTESAAARPGTPAAAPPSAETQRQMEAIRSDAAMPDQAKALSMNRAMRQEQQRRQ